MYYTAIAGTYSKNVAMSSSIPISIAYGDGIGPEIMQAVIRILKEIEAPLRFESIEIGEKIYKRHYSSGISDDAWQLIARTKSLLKGPITTPQGGGYKSLNVTLRKRLGLYANVRPSKALHPFVKTHFPDMDLVIIRENEEDLYTGIEYQHTSNTYESVKLISKEGSTRISQFAFDYAKKNNRKKLSCFSKDNIMKFTDGAFHKAFNDIALLNQDIKSEHYIVDIATAKLANNPEIFDVIVTSNLYGDIISDVAAEISGSVGMAGSANIGNNYAMFEAVHGSAPDISGQNIANPSGIINAAIMLLVHIGLSREAVIMENAWKKTIEDGFHTADIFNDATSSTKCTTDQFTSKIIDNLGYKPKQLKEAKYNSVHPKTYLTNINVKPVPKIDKKLLGIDVYIDFKTDSPAEIVKRLSVLHNKDEYKIYSISTKGLKVWPTDNEIDTSFPSEHWALRIKSRNEAIFQHKDITIILDLIASCKIDFIKVENLYEFNDQRGYSLPQGE